MTAKLQAARMMVLAFAPLLALVLAGGARAQAFSLDDVAARAQRLARAPYQAPPDRLPQAMRNLSQQRYEAIAFDPAAALWRDAGLGFEVNFHPTGRNYATPVTLHEITARGPRRLRFDPVHFDFGDLALDADTQASLDFAGFRVRHRGDPQQAPSDVLVFLGASHFRAIGSGQRFGASARALAVNPAALKANEQPRFTEFWIERPHRQDAVLRIYALLDGPGVTGAYRFVLRPGDTTTIDVQARLFARQGTDSVGVAPLAGMFLYGENQPAAQFDIRPEVHDVDGLSLLTGDGEWLWRPTVNPSRLLVTSFSTVDPRGFGLLQRDRSFASYQDPAARYEARPGVWIEPTGHWGPGRVELVQIPTRDEMNDNILAYWVPQTLPAAGQAVELGYRMYWHGTPVAQPQAWVAQTRRGPAGVPVPDGQVRFAVDFEGPAIAEGTGNGELTAVVSVGDNGELIEQHLIRNESTRGWRMVVQARRVDTAKPLELRAVLQRQGQPVSETWSYILPPR